MNAEPTDLPDDEPELRDVLAEKSILGIMLAESAAAAKAVRMIAAADFSEPLYGRIFSAIEQLLSNERPVTPRAVCEVLISDGNLLEIGGLARLTSFADDAYQTHSLAEAVKEVKAWAQKRELSERMGLANDRLYDPNLTVADVLGAIGNDKLAKALRREPPAQNAGGALRREPPAETAGGGFQPLRIWDAGEDSAAIPPRAWLLGNAFCRGFVSSLLAEGGSGKTSLRHAQLLALATAKPITGEHVFQRCRVLIVSLEDDENEVRRRIRAACIHHGVDHSELAGWLFFAAPGGSAGRLLVQNDGAFVEGPLAGMLREAIADKQLDLIMLDPFVKSHACEENSNGAIDAVVGLLTDMASRHHVAIDIPHHVSKGPADPGNASRGRGASAAKDAARLVYTLSRMTPDEAKGFGVPEAERLALIRVDSAKVNLAPATEAKWFRLVGVQLGNGNELYRGDEVATVEAWTPPAMWAEITAPMLNEILDEIDAGLPDGERYSGAPGAKDRAGWQVIVKHVPGKPEKQARQIIAKWLSTGLLTEKEYDSGSRRRKVKGLSVDSTKRPT